MVIEIRNAKQYHLKEFEFYDGEEFITFNIVNIKFENHTIEIAVTNRGKISVIECDLLQDCNGDFYFEYGCMLEKIKLDDFDTIKNKGANYEIKFIKY